MQRKEHLHHILSPPPFPAVFSSLSILQKLLSQTSCTITYPVNQGACHLPPSNHFFLSPHLLFLASSSLCPSTTVPVRAADFFPFPSPQVYLQEACNAPAAASGCWRRQHWGFLPLSPGSATSSPWCCCVIAAFPDCG